MLQLPVKHLLKPAQGGDCPPELSINGTCVSLCNAVGSDALVAMYPDYLGVIAADSDEWCVRCTAAMPACLAAPWQTA